MHSKIELFSRYQSIHYQLISVYVTSCFVSKEKKGRTGAHIIGNNTKHVKSMNVQK